MHFGHLLDSEAAWFFTSHLSFVCHARLLMPGGFSKRLLGKDLRCPPVVGNEILNHLDAIPLTVEFHSPCRNMTKRPKHVAPQNTIFQSLMCFHFLSYKTRKSLENTYLWICWVLFTSTEVPRRRPGNRGAGTWNGALFCAHRTQRKPWGLKPWHLGSSTSFESKQRVAHQSDVLSIALCHTEKECSHTDISHVTAPVTAAMTQAAKLLSKGNLLGDAKIGSLSVPR